MKNLKRLVSLVLTMVMVLTLLSVASAEEKIVLNLSMAISEQEKVDAEKTIARFEEKYPEYSVNLNVMTANGWADVLQKLLVQIASGEAPDVVYVAIEGCRMMVHNDMFLPMNDLIANDPDAKETIEDIPQSAWDAFTVDGQIYEVPFNCNSIIMLYNNEMFKNAGVAVTNDWTTDQFVEACKTVMAADSTGNTWGHIFNTNFIWPYMSAFGTSVLNEDMTASNLTDPRVKDCLQFMYDCVYTHGISPVPENNVSDGDMFMGNRVATLLAGGYMIATFEAANFTSFDATIMPRGNADGTGNFGIGGLGILSTCKYPEAAWKLCKEFASADNGMSQAAAGSSVPLQNSVATSEAWLSHCEHANIFYEELQNGVNMPCSANFTEVADIVNSMTFDILTNTTPIDEAIAAADAAIAESFANLD